MNIPPDEHGEAAALELSQNNAPPPLSGPGLRKCNPLVQSLSIRRRLVLLCLLVIAPILAVTVGLGIGMVKLDAQRELRALVSREMLVETSRMSQFFSQGMADARMLSVVPVMEGFVHSHDHNATALPEDWNQEDWLRHLTRACESMLSVRGCYTQARVLDMNGREVMRVNFQGDHADRVDARDLQDKHDRYYFREALRGAPGQTYISNIDLNREHGKVVMPPEPTVRFAQAIRDASGKVHGVLVLNASIAEMLPSDLKKGPKTVKWSFVTDQDGRYLHNGLAPEKEWGGPADRNTGDSLSRDFPTLTKAILAGHDHQEPLAADSHYVFTQTLRVFDDPSRFLVLGYVVPAAAISNRIWAIGGVTVGISLVGILVALLAAMGLGRSVVQPVRGLTSAVERFQKGDATARVPEDGPPELQGLACTFNRMADTLTARQRSLRELLSKHTRDLEESQANLRRRAGWAEGLQKAGEDLAGCRTVDDTVHRAVRAPVDRLDMAMAWITTFDADGQERTVAVYPHKAKTIVDMGAHLCPAEACAKGSAIIRTEPSVCPIGSFTGDHSLCASYPILVDDRYAAALSVRGKPDDRGEMVRAANPLLEVFCRNLGYVWERCLAEDELAAARDAAEAANRAKSDFLASMSHELRTPLNAIIGFSEVLIESYFGDLNERQTEYVKDILGSGQHLLLLINDILDLSKIEAGQMSLDLAPVHVADLLRHSLTLIREKCNRHGVVLRLEKDGAVDGLTIVADQRRIRQVLYNLLSNAAKFTPDGGAIALGAAVRHDEIRISVADTGIGIAPKDLENVFESFFQTTAGSISKTPGTGLGLSISRQIVEMHGGRIWAESDGLNQGATFHFQIPILADAMAGTPADEQGTIQKQEQTHG